MSTGPLLAALGLASVHLLCSHLRFLDTIPRSRWLSFAGGVAVAYVLLHLLPELQESGTALAELSSEGSRPDAQAIYVLTLLGLILFYGLEKVAITSKARGGEATPSPAVFWLHTGSFAAYNVLIGYLLVREDRSWQSLLLFFIGIGLHFVVNDYGLRRAYQQRYRRIGRWLLSASIVVGWAVGNWTALHELVTAAAISFLAGGILLNTFKEELPEERESRFGAFAFGAIGYAIILLAM